MNNKVIYTILILSIIGLSNPPLEIHLNKVEFIYDQRNLGIHAKRDRGIHFDFEFKNNTKKNILLFPVKSGKYFGMYTPYLIIDKDTVAFSQATAIDFDCYPADTLFPGKRLKCSLDLNSHFIRSSKRSIGKVDELYNLDVKKAALNYNMNFLFDTIKEYSGDSVYLGFKDKKCQEYYQVSIISNYTPIQKSSATRSFDTNKK
jgi:hypothetical protein